MSVTIKYPEDFPLSGFERDVFELLVVDILGGDSFSDYRFRKAIGLIGVNGEIIGQQVEKFKVLNNVKFKEYKPKFLADSLEEIGDALGGIKVVLKQGSDDKYVEKISITYPDNFPLIGFERDAFETLIAGLFSGSFFSICGFRVAIEMVKPNDVAAEEGYRKFEALHCLNFKSFKPGFLDKLLMEMGACLGGIEIKWVPEKVIPKVVSSYFPKGSAWIAVLVFIMIVAVPVFVYSIISHSPTLAENYEITHLRNEISGPATHNSLSSYVPPPQPMEVKKKDDQQSNGLLSELLSAIKAGDGITLDMKHGEIVKITIKN